MLQRFDPCEVIVLSYIIATFGDFFLKEGRVRRTCNQLPLIRWHSYITDVSHMIHSNLMKTWERFTVCLKNNTLQVLPNVFTGTKHKTFAIIPVAMTDTWVW